VPYRRTCAVAAQSGIDENSLFDFDIDFGKIGSSAKFWNMASSWTGSSSLIVWTLVADSPPALDPVAAPEAQQWLAAPQQ
jgi:hypothetical protein